MSSLAQATFERLDAISRVRALTELESIALERAIYRIDIDALQRRPKKVASRSCSQCPGEIGRRNTTGLCRSCLAKKTFNDPEVRLRQRLGFRTFLANPRSREVLGWRRNRGPAA